MCSELYISNNALEVTLTCSELICSNSYIKPLCPLPQFNENFKSEEYTYITHLSQSLLFQMKASKYSPGETEHWKKSEFDNGILLSNVVVSSILTHVVNYIFLRASCAI